jgi:hypothetical protein
LLLVGAGLALLLVNGFALRTRRRYTHSVLWRRSIGRLQARNPTLLLGGSRFDQAARVVNVLGLALGLILVLAGLTG